MRQIIPGLHYFTGLTAGRVYAIKDPDGLTLIDAGLALAAPKIIAQLAAAGHKPADVKRILVTHAHADHVAGLHALHAQTGAEIVASPVEQPVIEGQIPIPRPDPAALSGFSRLARLRLSPVTVFEPTPVHRPLVDGDILPEVMGGLTVVATPGHTPGHLSFWQSQRRILFCGDVLFHMTGLSLPFAAFTVDMAENKRSVLRLAQLQPALVCFGHGPILANNAAAAISAFARKINAL